jgi:hypothetical protein
MERKYKCKHCNKMITVKDGMCSTCEEKLGYVRILLRMAKNPPRKKACDRDKL